MTKIQNIDTIYWQECEVTGTVIHCRAEGQNCTATFKTFWKFLKKVNTLLTYDPAITLFGVY